MNVNYLGHNAVMESLKNPIELNGETYYPLFTIVKNGVKIARHFNNEKTYNFTYSQAVAYNKIVKGLICFNGMSII